MVKHSVDYSKKGLRSSLSKDNKLRKERNSVSNEVMKDNVETVALDTKREQIPLQVSFLEDTCPCHGDPRRILSLMHLQTSFKAKKQKTKDKSVCSL